MKTSLALVIMTMTIGACIAEEATRRAKVSPTGVLVWEDDGSEVALFGVNYYTPFTPDYGLMREKGLIHRRAIREDVNHFQRLGLTAIRLHCFDRQISDSEGNLLENDQLELLDLLIAECKKRGIYSVMTPMAWWPPRAGGFSDRFTMHEMTTSPESRPPQKKYLTQFMNHVNVHTGLPYKEDPALVCIEIINEPHYPEGTTDEAIAGYIDEMCETVRATGCEKPIFFHSWLGRKERAVSMSSADGATFGWYPTGLVAGQMLRGNYLGLVEDYPEMRADCLKSMPKIVYEFDAADVHGRVMYPAMARAFRSGGCQIATQFQYDPMCLAARNENWQTHYLNLVYTPGKAISFAIAAEVFRHVPRLAAFDSYPEGGTFQGFRIDFQKDLSEYLSDEAFLYANDTDTVPPHPEMLTHIAGCGSSPLIDTDATGAYFLDKKATGLWRLQVYPDAVLVADPYEGGSNEKTRLVHADHEMTIRLPDLGDRFQYIALHNDAWGWGHEYQRMSKRSEGATITVSPGEYLLTGQGIDAIKPFPPEPSPKSACIFPRSSPKDPTAWCRLPARWREGKSLALEATVPAPKAEARLLARPGPNGMFLPVAMDKISPYVYQGEIPAEFVIGEELHIQLAVDLADGSRLFPGRGSVPEEGAPPRDPASWELLNVKQTKDISGFRLEGGKDARASIEEEGGQKHLSIRAEGFPADKDCTVLEWPVDPTNMTDGFPSQLVMEARGGDDTTGVEVSLAQKDGKVFGDVLPLMPGWNEVRLSLDELKPIWWGKGGSRLDPGEIHHVNFVFGAWLFGEFRDRPHSVEVRSLRLTEEAPWWTVPLRPDSGPVLLLEPAGLHVKPHGHPVHLGQALGMDRDKRAFRATVKGFGDPPDCTSIKWHIREEIEAWRDCLTETDTLLVKGRAAFPQTTCVELVLLEEDGSPWGVDRLPLSESWQEIRVPLSQLRYFSHWDTEDKDRGGEEDGFHPDRVCAVNLCFGAWLYGGRRGEAHGFEIQEISLAKPEPQRPRDPSNEPVKGST